MFIGEYSHNIDEKGRLAVPAKFRTLLTEGAVVTRGFDNCLFLYPKDKWSDKAQEIASRPSEKANERAYSRMMLSGAMEAEFDSQGRINVPEYLRTYAGLKKKAVIAGLYDRLEIWDEESWQAYKSGIEKDFNRIAESVSETII